MDLSDGALLSTGGGKGKLREKLPQHLAGTGMGDSPPLSMGSATLLQDQLEAGEFFECEVPTCRFQPLHRVWIMDRPDRSGPRLIVFPLSGR